MDRRKGEPKRLEDHEPGATKKQVLAALVKAAKPVKKPVR